MDTVKGFLSKELFRIDGFTFSVLVVALLVVAFWVARREGVI